MKPIDPRLLRYARATRLFLAAVVALGVVGAALVIAQAMLIAEVVVGGFEDGLTVSGLRTPLILLAAVALGRGLVAWLTELAAYRASAAVKSELRGRLLARAASLGPGWLSGQRTGSLVALATRGVDALDDYFARYLPQLGLAVVVPVAVLARIVTEDWVSAAIIVVTLPLIPLFMILIGWATQSRMDRQWLLLSRLSGHFLDVVAGLPTLKVFGRAKAQAESIRTITSQYRRATLRTLRIAFLSSFALELLATLSVALVAVTIGMRLVHGELDLYTGLVVLILAPEAYLPIRQVGAQYHAAAEGLSAAEEIFAVLETEPRQAGTADVPGSLRLELEGVTVRHEGRTEPSLDEASLVVDEGETVALVGPSGVGKSTLLDVVLGFTSPDEGWVRIGGVDLATLAPEQWRERIAWVPQRPYLFAGTIGENVRLARPDADDRAVTAALRDAGAYDFVAELPDGARTLIGEDGAGLSAGQRQRLALARAFLADRPLLLLDEPTASLDGETEEGIVEAVRRLAVGRTVLLVVHRPALLSVADRVVTLDPGATERPTRTAASVVVPRPASPPSFPDKGTPEPAALRETSARSGRVLARVRRPPGHSAAGWRSRCCWAASPGLGRRAHGRLRLADLPGLRTAPGALSDGRRDRDPSLRTRPGGLPLRRAPGVARRGAQDARRTARRGLPGLERIAPAGLRHTRRGDLLSRLVADVDALQDYWLRWLLPAGTAVAVGTAAAGFIGWLLPAAGVVLAAGLLLAGVGVPLVSSACSRHTERRLAPARADLATRITDLLGGTAELTVAGALPARAERTRDADGVLTRIAARAATANALGGGLIALVTGLTVVATALVALPAVHDGRLAGVELAVVVLTPLAAFEAVAGLPLAVQYRRRVERSAERVYEVLDAPLPVHEPESPAEAPTSPFPLEVRGLSARYAGAARDALDGVDLTLTAGRRIAVVGPSGSGKTTLAQVLVRFLDARAGTYRIGGAEAGELEGDAVRRFVGLCAQDAHVFDSTIRENLRLARTGATEEELRDALGRARLLDWADALPDGLDTLVGEHGARLSGGQRQRLALARAILADFPVLVLDEPAEHLDLATADALTADLLAATEGRTTVLITHRLKGLEAVDEVLVLDEGRIVQRGPYADLAAGEGPLRRMLERERETTRRVPGREAARTAGEAVGAPA